MRVSARLLLAFVALVAVALVTATAYLLIPALMSEGGTIAAAGGLRNVVQVRVGILWTGILAAVIAVVGAVWIGELLSRSLEGIRARVATLPQDRGSSRSPVSEVRGLSAAVARASEDLRQREVVLRAREEEAKRLLESVGEGILQLDATGRVVRYNTAARSLLRLPESAQGEPFETIVRDLQLRSALGAALEERSTQTGELRPEDRVLFYTIRPIRIADGSAIFGGVALAILDITDLRRLETVRRDFVANASHELKTPLTSIRGYAETLLGDELEPGMRRRFLSTIAENAQRLQHIVDDLLDLSRIESGGWVPELGPVRLDQAAAEAWEPFAARAEQRGITFRIEPSTGLEVSADETALRQILTNLFDNAIRHTPAGGVIRTRAEPLRSADAASAGPGRVAIEIADTGSGIPRDALERVFERFYRVDPARSREEGGTGLGLSIVKHLTESMGGRVEAQSDLGRGTTVRLTLPAPGEPLASGTPPLPLGGARA